MTKNTLRDTVWREIIRQRDDDSRILKPDIQQQVDAGDRTVHDVLQTAVEYGLLDRSTTIEDRDDPRTEGATQRKEVVVFDPAELDDREVDDDTVPLDDDQFADESGDTGSKSGEDDTAGKANPTPDADNNETVSVPESDLDDDGYVDVDWPPGSASNYAGNIDNIGRKKAERLANHYDNFDSIIKASMDDLTVVRGIGDSIAEDIKRQMIRFALNEIELDIEDVPEVEREVFADMFNVPNDVAESFQANIIMHRDVYE
ncbi:MAG: helix-hairpin-helix domain-containing protein [Candidatus Paceibacteria bacterium]